MKNNSILLGLFTLTMLLSFTESCKRGEDDPTLSLKSRNARIMGTWTLKSYENKESEASTTRVTNNENDDDYNYSSNVTSTEKYNGTNITTSYTKSVDYTMIDMWYDNSVPKWRDQEEVYSKDSATSSTQSFTFTIALYSDNTCEITTTTGNSSGTFAWSWDLDYDDDNDPYADDTNDDDDGDWSVTESVTTVEQGTWYWEDNTKEGKLYLNAGSLKGKIVRLSSKELVIEARFGALKTVDQLGNPGEETSDVGSNTVVDEDVNLQAYNDQDQFDYNKGDRTTVSTWNNTETLGVMVFEKTDKAKKRPTAGQ